MKVWIDQDLCTGDGLCEEIAPDVFTLLDDGLAYVKEGATVFATAKGNPQGAEGMAEIPDGQLDARKDQYSYENANFALMRVMTAYLLGQGAQADAAADPAQFTADCYVDYVRDNVLTPMGSNTR